VSCGDEDEMMVESPPAAPLEVIEPELAFQLLIVAFDPPTDLCDDDEPLEGGRSGRFDK